MISKHEEVVAANIKLHTVLSERYDVEEPHFRAENIKAVSKKLNELIEGKSDPTILDLGCGTGFIVNILRDRTCSIDGVDITPAMLNKVSTEGVAKVQLYESDSATFNGLSEYYDLVTAYSFLHHLYDYQMTLENAYRMLKQDGLLYIDLEPNFYYWQSLRELDRSQRYSAVIEREISQTIEKDDDIEKRFGVPGEIFNAAEFGKNVKGGLKADELKETLHQIGFRKVSLKYNWFLGQGKMINDPKIASDFYSRVEYGRICEDALRNCLPLSLHLFKYFEVTAVK